MTYCKLEKLCKKGTMMAGCNTAYMIDENFVVYVMKTERPSKPCTILMGQMGKKNYTEILIDKLEYLFHAKHLFFIFISI